MEKKQSSLAILVVGTSQASGAYTHLPYCRIIIFLSVIHVSSTFPFHRQLSSPISSFGVCAGETNACCLARVHGSTSDLDPSHRPAVSHSLTHALLLPDALATADTLRQQRDGLKDDEQLRPRRPSAKFRKQSPSDSRQ